MVCGSLMLIPLLRLEMNSLSTVATRAATGSTSWASSVVLPRRAASDPAILIACLAPEPFCRRNSVQAPIDSSMRLHAPAVGGCVEPCFGQGLSLLVLLRIVATRCWRYNQDVEGM
jgi:hypothetical protein